MPLAKTTKDHDEIRKWAEARGGKPAVVASTEGKNQTGILRIMFPNAPNHKDGALEEISWDEFFEKFDESGLQLTYQDKTSGGQKSDFNKLTYPDPDSREGKALLKESAGKKSSGKKAAGSKSAAKTVTKKTAARETAGKRAAAVKKTPATKKAAKKPVSRSASKRSVAETPARNYPRPEPGDRTQVY